MSGDAKAESVVSFANAATAIAGETIWANVTLDLLAGEFVAILGPNGAGKSTLLKSVLGLQSLSSGTAQVLGDAPGQHNQRIGYLPQRRTFDPGLPIRGRDLVRLGLDGHKWAWPLPLVSKLMNRNVELENRRLVDTAIADVGATDYAERRIGRTSGGEQQRLLIAQALVRSPRILLLDEPLDSLDIPNQHSVSSLIKSIALQHNIMVMMVAHDVNPILPYLDRVIYVANGHVIAGSPDEIIRTETLSSLYGSTVEVLRTSDGRLVVAGAPDAIHAHSHAVR